jgi:hypothetical protein
MNKEHQYEWNRTIDITQQVRDSYDEGLAKGFCIGIIIGSVLSIMTCITYIISRGHIL